MDRATYELDAKEAVCQTHGTYESKAIVIFGRLMRWTECPECARLETEKEEATKREIEERDRQRRIENRLNQAGIPLRFRTRTFENFVADGKGKAAALGVAESFARAFSERYAAGATMVFSGPPGTGKSHLAIAVCTEIMRAGHTAMYLNAMDAIRLVRSTWSRNSERTESQVMQTLTDVDLLVLDEVGAQYGTEGEQVILFDIINRRYQDQLPMILLTNQAASGFRDYLGDRAFDRLREAGKWVTFDWQSHRGQA